MFRSKNQMIFADYCWNNLNSGRRYSYYFRPSFFLCRGSWHLGSGLFHEKEFLSGNLLLEYDDFSSIQFKVYFA